MPLPRRQDRLGCLRTRALPPERISDGSTLHDGPLSHVGFRFPKEDGSEACPLCVADDRREHFLRECVAVSDLRLKWLDLGTDSELRDLIQYHC